MNECPLCGQEYVALSYNGVLRDLRVDHGDDIICTAAPVDIEGRPVR